MGKNDPHQARKPKWIGLHELDFFLKVGMSIIYKLSSHVIYFFFRSIYFSIIVIIDMLLIMMMMMMVILLFIILFYFSIYP